MKNLIILFALFTAIFLAYPQIDLMVVDLTYESTKGFIWIDQAFFRFIYKSLNYIVPLTIISLSLTFILRLTYKNNKTKIQVFYLMACLIVGPGLIINLGLKENFGRARPAQIKEKDKKFSPIFFISDQCVKNCSFTSGHAAMGFYYSAFSVFFTNRKYKISVVTLSILFGSLLGLSRILQGAHFLSDIIFSGIIINIVNYALYKIFSEKLKT